MLFLVNWTFLHPILRPKAFHYIGALSAVVFLQPYMAYLIIFTLAWCLAALVLCNNPVRNDPI